MLVWLLAALLGADTQWVAVGKSGSVSATESGATLFQYSAGEGMTGAVLPLAGKDLTKMDALRFRVKTDMPTALAVVLSEKQPGGNYAAVCWSTGNTWQHVELLPSDFHLNAGPKDPVDPDGKLDLDAIGNLAILDTSIFFSVNPNQGPMVVESHLGKRTLSIDGFEIVTGSGAKAPAKSVIDAFTSPQLQWMTLGGAELKPEARGMRADYQQFDGKLTIVTHPLANADLRGMDKLAFEVSSEVEAQLLMSFEMKAPGKEQGPRFNALVEVPGGGKIAHREVLLSAFEHGDDSPEGDLDWGKLKTFAVVDITGTVTHDTAKNSLWIGNIRGVAEQAGQ